MGSCPLPSPLIRKENLDFINYLLEGWLGGLVEGGGVVHFLPRPSDDYYIHVILTSGLAFLGLVENAPIETDSQHILYFLFFSYIVMVLIIFKLV